MVKFEGKVEVTKTTFEGGGSNMEAIEEVTRSKIILDAGENGHNISLRMLNDRAKTIFDLSSYFRTFSLNTEKGWTAVSLSAFSDGGIIVYNKEGNGSIIMDGRTSKIFLLDKSGKYKITMDGINGHVIMRDAADNSTMFIDGSSGSLYLKGHVVLRDAADKDAIVLDGPSGDIVLNNADCAEDFDILHSTAIDPGTVMVIEQEGKLKECDLPYDKRVAGVLSGAGNYKPGLVLDKRKSIGNRKSISLMGKVHCKVDAQSAPIDVGDLLTTSSTKGHAMKAADPAKAFGSVIGKALHPLRDGTGLIPILIALQ
jgi:hypothetical protein